MKLLFFLPLLFIAHLTAHGQVVTKKFLPKNPNVTDAKGLRQGWWTLAFDESGFYTTDSLQTYVYRVAQFTNNKPTGAVRGYYYPSHQLQFEGASVSEEEQLWPRVDISQPFHFYSPQGVEIIGAAVYARASYFKTMKRDFEKAYSLYDTARIEFEKQFGKKNPYYVGAMEMLALTSMNIGNYHRAEVAIRDAAKYHLTFKGKNALYAEILLITYMVYGELGNLDKAEAVISECAMVTKQTLGSSSSMYGKCLSALAWIRMTKEDFQSAAAFYGKAVDLLKRRSETATHNFTNLTFNYGVALLMTGQWQKGDSCFRAGAVALSKPQYANTDFMASALGRWAILQLFKKETRQADSLFHAARTILETKYGENYPAYLSLLTRYSSALMAVGQLPEAEEVLRLALGGTLRQIVFNFPTMSESEKEAFLKTKGKVFENMNAFMLQRHSSNPDIAGDLYDQQLAVKGLLLNSASKWKKRILTSGDKKLFGIYTKWESNRAVLARYYKQGENKRKIDSLESVTDLLEKELSQRSEMFATLADKHQATWQEIKGKLAPNEVAVEMVRIKKMGIKMTMIDSSNGRPHTIPGLVDTIHYAALVIAAKSPRPELVIFTNGNELEGNGLSYYRNSIMAQTEDNRSYHLFWKPLANKISHLLKIRSGAHVFFSGDGVFNQLNLSTLRNPATGQYVQDEVSISLVTNTKDLLIPASDHLNTLAYLFGNPNYEGTGDTSLQTETEEDKVIVAERGTGLANLPGTKKEVEAIASLMKANGLQTEMLLGNEAQEEKLKDCFKPKVLHIATHGYFEPDTTREKNPLMLSGLMFAGAAKGKSESGEEDGILTAYEAMNLNLDNTEMVVLSACETGLGEIKNGEGVYGLQRAFKVAGARTLIMSLWKVNDQATQQLMTHFYSWWLQGVSKRQAFRHAQAELRISYPQPYYWGAFVMVGE